MKETALSKNREQASHTSGRDRVVFLFDIYHGGEFASKIYHGGDFASKIYHGGDLAPKICHGGDFVPKIRLSLGCRRLSFSFLK